jgi:adenine-specific DNA methylase
MSQEIGDSAEDERTTLPIEKGFPIERVNEIAAKEGRAKMHYRPIYTMHKWWARRLGCVFRTISLYTLLDDSEGVEVHEPGKNGRITDYGNGKAEIEELVENVDMSDPESLWPLYTKDVRIPNKKILDPFAGGGTSLVEASRFGAETVGNDLNPVAWFVTKKELEAGQVDVSELDEAFEEVQEQVAEDILQYYRTPCPNVNGEHKADVMYNFWVKELDCVSCDTTVPLFRDFRVAKGRYENDDKYNVLCPECESVILVDDWKSESECSECNNKFVPEEGNIDYGDYNCPDCGQQYPVTDAIEEQGGFNLRLYAVEYYCGECDSADREKSQVKGYKPAKEADSELFEEAKREWEESTELRQYVPDKEIRPGWKTDANQFEGTMPGNGNLPRHGYYDWTDMYNERQLLCLSKLLKSISEYQNQEVAEYLLLAVSDALRTNSMMTAYDPTRNGMGDIFRDNNFNPPLYPAENNVWGTKYGRGTFTASFDMVRDGVEWAGSPTERYVEDGETKTLLGKRLLVAS